MVASLVGFRHVDFKDDSGRHITGTSLYIAYNTEDRNVIGQVAGKVFWSGTVDPTWLGQAIKLDYSFDPITKNAKLIDVSLAD